MKLTAVFLFGAFAYAQNPNTAVYPGAIATDLDLLVANNNARTTLAVGIDAAQTTITLSSAAKFITPMTISIDGAAGTTPEILNCPSHIGTVYTCSLHFDGSAAVSHASQSVVHGNIVAWPVNQLSSEVKAIEATLGVNLGNVSGCTPTGSKFDILSNASPGCYGDDNLIRRYTPITATPPTAVLTGATGAVQYCYDVVPITSTGPGVTSGTPACINNGIDFASMNVSNYNTVSTTAVAGAINCAVIRISDFGGTERIDNNTLACGVALQDTGLAATSLYPESGNPLVDNSEGIHYSNANPTSTLQTSFTLTGKYLSLGGGNSTTIIPTNSFITPATVIGFGNTVDSQSANYGTTILGNTNTITGRSHESIIFGDFNTIDSNRDIGVIVGGDSNTMTNSGASDMVAGIDNTMTDSTDSDMWGNVNLVMTNSGDSIMACNVGCVMTRSSDAEIFGGVANTITDSGDSSIYGDSGNVIQGGGDDAIYANSGNTITTSNGNNSIFAGSVNHITGSNSSIIVGSQRNTITSANKAMAIGSYTTTTANGAYTFGTGILNTGVVLANAHVNTMCLGMNTDTCSVLLGDGGGTAGGLSPLTVVGTFQKTPTSTNPGCTASGDLGKFWIDSTTAATTHFKVCANVASTPTWVSVF